MRPATLRTPAVVIAGALLGCTGSPSTPNGMGRVVFQIATSGIGASAAPVAADVVITKGSDVLVVSQVQLVARKIRFRRAAAACAADPNQEEAPGATPGAESSHEHQAEEHECPTLKLGPLLLEPPLTEGAATTFTADVPAGTYDRIRLQVHKPRGDRDQAFLTAHPDFAGVSLRVKGTFNGAPFSFDTAIEEEEEITLTPPVEVTASGTTAFTLFLDVRGWFLNSSGSALVDPTAGATARSLIEHNIRSSFRAFRDDDHDGHDDDHGGH